MSTAADRARAKAARIAATASPETEPTAEDLKKLKEAVRFAAQPEASSVPVGVKPIRISLDLAPALFDQLTEWRTKAARQLGRGRVTNADVLRVLVRSLLSDEELTARVIAGLRRESDT